MTGNELPLRFSPEEAARGYAIEIAELIEKNRKNIENYFSSEYKIFWRKLEKDALTNIELVVFKHRAKQQIGEVEAAAVVVAAGALINLRSKYKIVIKEEWTNS